MRMRGRHNNIVSFYVSLRTERPYRVDCGHTFIKITIGVSDGNYRNYNLLCYDHNQNHSFTSTH